MGLRVYHYKGWTNVPASRKGHSNEAGDAFQEEPIQRCYKFGEGSISFKLSLSKEQVTNTDICLKSQSFDQTLIVDIFRRYGDHLYSKGDYDGAINQYLKTIGPHLPSYMFTLQDTQLYKYQRNPSCIKTQTHTHTHTHTEIHHHIAHLIVDLQVC